MIAPTLVAGVDEAGRGPLAGPVVAAAVILCGKEIRGLADSKVLDAATRAKLALRIRERCHVGVGIASVAEIDSLNIFHATMLAMTRAVEMLCAEVGCDPVEVLVDGNLTPRGRREEWRWPARPVVGGDAKVRTISAASIVAKQHRDALMIAEHERVPHYGFARHKGYGTPEHLAALRTHGPCDLHRRSFAPVARAPLFAA
ncbi:ribonuclease HII [Sphingomonas sp. LY160]|uniref:ribonuclease HII n=1 Tax=Sphingomonas sp. LY160 TaxID=3095342 RepID=UPI002ADECF41|nr:ribonuclease HII [Sphingomonas sp. LY160]MEA1070997.1 ribonuclease HII [Sphingomonas sp. LY160]